MSSGKHPLDRSLTGAASLEHRAYGLYAAETLYQLIGYVADFERREHQDVCASAQRALAGALVFATLGTSAASACSSPSRISDGDISPCNTCGLDDLVDPFVGGASLCGEAEDGHARLDAGLYRGQSPLPTQLSGPVPWPMGRALPRSQRK